jgi:3-polyprenyl-4-hydroxybenzoate decarboxylase
MDDLINFVVSRILDQLEIENDLIARWASREGI